MSTAMTGWEILALRALGGFGGALIAMAIIQPNTWSGAGKRLAVSLASALMLTPALRDYLGWPQTPDNIRASACIVGALSWWTWHGIIRALEAGWVPWVKKPSP